MNMIDKISNQIVLPIPNNRYISIVQNAKGHDCDQDGIRHGDYGKRVEIAILDSKFNYIHDLPEMNYGVKGHLSTEQLAKEIINLIIGDCTA